jgi:peptidoglycan/xylan/chitin deacetylase (PgdA/CDA1 family)
MNPLLAFCVCIGLISVSIQADYPFIVKSGKPRVKQIALTFDDGPHPKHTEYVLSVLASENIKATFFLLGKNIETFPDLAKKINRAGHELGNHSYSHRNFHHLNQVEIMEEIKASQYQFYSVFGTFPIYFRPPYGNINRRDLPLAKQYFHRIIKWSIDTNDWRKSANPNTIKKLILNKVRPGSIILFHEKHIRALGNLDEIISSLKNEGYEFVTVSKFLEDELPLNSLKNGMIY